MRQSTKSWLAFSCFALSILLYLFALVLSNISLASVDYGQIIRTALVFAALGLGLGVLGWRLSASRVGPLIVLALLLLLHGSIFLGNLGRIGLF